MYIKKTVLIIILLLQTSFISFPLVKSQESNVTVHVNVLQTYANGSYREYYAFNAEVKLVSRSNPNITYVGYTNNYGIVEFRINLTDTYSLNINYPDAYFEEKYIHLRQDILNEIYEKVYKLAKFFEGSQNTVAKTIKLELPASISVKFPQSVVNFSIISYELRVKTYKSNTWFTVEFLDECRMAVEPETGLFYQMNYTVNLTLTTITAGVISFMSVNNGTVNMDFSSLYYVPQDVTVTFMLIVITEKPRFYESIEEINRKLDNIIQLLLQLLELTNKTVIPRLGNLQNSLANFSTLLIGRFNEFSNTFTANVSILNVLSEKLSEVKQTVTGIRDTQNIFVNDYPFQTRNVLNEYLGDMKNSSYANMILLLIALVLIFARTRPEKESKERVGSVIIRG